MMMAEQMDDDETNMMKNIEKENNKEDKRKQVKEDIKFKGSVKPVKIYSNARTHPIYDNIEGKATENKDKLSSRDAIFNVMDVDLDGSLCLSELFALIK